MDIDYSVMQYTIVVNNIEEHIQCLVKLIILLIEIVYISIGSKSANKTV